MEPSRCRNETPRITCCFLGLLGGRQGSPAILGAGKNWGWVCPSKPGKSEGFHKNITFLKTPRAPTSSVSKVVGVGGFGGSWTSACLAFLHAVLLSSALLGAAISFGLCCVFGFKALTQKKGRPASASRFRLRPCVPRPFGCPRKCFNAFGFFWGFSWHYPM